MPYTPNNKWSNYINAIFRDDNEFVSEWRLDNITSGSGLDSQGTNNLTASGSPTQVAGQMLSSGVEFDGINDCFYITSGDSSKLYPFQPRTDYKIGFIGNLYIDDFSTERVIFAKWNDTSPKKSLIVSITPQSGIRVRANRKSTPSTTDHFDSITNMVPSGEWFKFAIGITQRGASNRNYHVWINDFLWSTAINSWANEFDEDGTGTFSIGAANVGEATPSGFFKGKMENLLFFNGRSERAEEYNYWASGYFPSGTRPGLNSWHPYMEGLWHLNDIRPAANGQPAYLEERVNNLKLFPSGSASGNILLLPGAADGAWGSGVGFPNTTNAQLAIHALTIPTNTVDFGSSFTLSAWVYPRTPSAVQRTFFGMRTLAEIGFSSSMIPRLDWFQQDANAIAIQPTTSLRISNNVWSHITYVVDAARCSGTIYVSGVSIGDSNIDGSGLFGYNKNNIPAPTTLSMGLINNIDNPFSGILDEVVYWNYPLTSGEVWQLYNSQSGFINIANAPSALIGGFLNGTDANYASGLLGGYIWGPPVVSGLIGGYISGVPRFASGLLGGYLTADTLVSGALGGYLRGKIDYSGILGGYLKGQVPVSGILGGYLLGLETNPLDSSFQSFFIVKGLYNTDFDASVRIYKQLSSDFDAQVFIYRQERKPLVRIINPATTQSGLAPQTYQFEANASGLDGKSIVYTQWILSDIPVVSGSIISSSGTYQTSHTFAKSGLFNVIFLAIDSDGLANSDRVIINTASGISIPDITLYASPLSGISPLECTFSGVINSSIRPIKNQSFYFGDGAASASVLNIKHKYQVPGCYIPIYRVDDVSGFISTDTVEIGSNN